MGPELLNRIRCAHQGCASRIDFVGPVGNAVAVGWHGAGASWLCPLHRDDGIDCDSVAGKKCGICKANAVARAVHDTRRLP
jgi:hypothetical protein